MLIARATVRNPAGQVVALFDITDQPQTFNIPTLLPGQYTVSVEYLVPGSVTVTPEIPAPR